MWDLRVPLLLVLPGEVFRVELFGLRVDVWVVVHTDGVDEDLNGRKQIELPYEIVISQQFYKSHLVSLLDPDVRIGDFVVRSAAPLSEKHLNHVIIMLYFFCVKPVSSPAAGAA